MHTVDTASPRQPRRLTQLTPWVWTGMWPGETRATLIAKEGRAEDPEALEREWQALHQVPTARLPEPVALLRDATGRAQTLWLRLRPGVALDEALDAVPLSERPQQAVVWTQQALRTLGALHAAGLVHGDLHPGNLLVDRHVGLTLLDLGLASPPGRAQDGCGHPQFAPPQRLMGQAVDVRDDVFSLALSVWRGLGLPQPWPDYPAVLPPAHAVVVVPPDVPAPLLPLARVLAGWLAIDRDQRPQDAERALRRLGDLTNQTLDDARQTLADDLRALHLRPARFRAIPLLPSVPGSCTWIVGGAGTGRTSLLAQVADARRRDGADVLVLDAADVEHLRAGVADVPQRPVEFGALGDPIGVEQARWVTAWQQLWARLGPQHVLCVDDVDRLGPLPRRALESVLDVRPQSGPAVVLVTDHAPPGSEILAVPPLTPAELGGHWQAASQGRQWDARVLAEAVWAQHGARASMWRLAAALVASPLVHVSFDRVDVAPDADLAALVRDALATELPLTLPEPDVWPTLAQLAVEPLYTVVPAPTGVTHPSVAALVHVQEAGWRLRSPAVRHFLRSHLPDDLLAGTALRRAGVATSPLARTALQLDAAAHGTPVVVDQADLLDLLHHALLTGAPHEAAEYARIWLADAPVGPSARVWALRLRALALMDADAWRAEASAMPAADRSTPDVLLALAEAHFRRGDYPACRAEVASLVDAPDVVVQSAAHLWRAFAATWQGDRPAAHAAVAAGQALAVARHGPWFGYLQALGAYYAGDLAAARALLTDLQTRTDPGVGLHAALAGALGLVAHRAGELGTARAHYEDARQQAERGGDRLRALNMTMNVATLDHEQGDLGRALAGYDRVVTAARRLDNPGALARALGNRGNLLAQLGDDARARVDVAEARTAYAAQGNRYLAGNVGCVLAELARRGGQWQEADALLTQAEADLADAQAQAEWLEIRLERGELLRVTGHAAAAVALADSVASAALALGSPELWARAAWLRGRLQLDADRPPVALCTDVASRLQEAAAAIPAGKPLLRVAVSTDAARALALGGQWAAAASLAQTALAQLETVATSLTAMDAQRFLHGTVLGPVRALLQPLAHAQVPQAAPTVTGTPALGSILAINRRMGAQEDLQSLLEIVMDSAVLLTGAERGFLILQHEGELRVMVARNLDRENLKKAALKLSWGIARQVFQRGDRVLTTDAQEDDRFRTQASVHHGSLRSILCVPMAWQGQPIGALYVDNRFAAGAFSQEHAGVLEALADQASIAVEHARVVDRERRARQKLQESQAEVTLLAEKLQGQLDEAEHALDDARAELTAQRLDVQRRSDYSQIRGESPALLRLFGLMDRVRDHDFPVLVVGESGTGKELVARAIHFTGRRQKAPFLAINCAALPSALLESELFGHVRGAFTGAIADRKGLFEAADGGTLFLDEIGEMPLDMQPKLLRVLQTGELQRVGDTRTRTVRVRVVAATHRNLPEMAEAGQFRPDLLFRLRVVELAVPALRQRPEDIALLAEHFLAENRREGIGHVDGMTPAALKRLREFAWPGNVRQLETVLKSASLFAVHPQLDVADLEPLLGRDKASDGGGMRESWWREAPLDEIVQRAVVDRVATMGGNKRRAAESLGIDRTTLYTRLRQATGEG